MILSVSNRLELWDIEVWGAFIQVAILLVAIVIGNTIRRKVGFIRNSLIPSSVLAGLLIFVFKFIPFVNDFINADMMEKLTYHCLGLGFIALSLKAGVKTKDENRLVVMDSGLITVNTYLVQALVGLGITILLSVTVKVLSSSQEFHTLSSPTTDAPSNPYQSSIESKLNNRL